MAALDGDTGVDSRTILVHGRPVAVRELAGDPPPLVFLHEALGSIELWRSFPQQLCGMSGRRGVVFDRFGHGRSAPPSGPRSHRYHREEALGVLPAVLAETVDHAPILVGHSDGASIALLHAGAEHTTCGLVLIAPHVFVEETGRTGIRMAVEQYRHDDLATRLGRYHDHADRLFWDWVDIWLDPEFATWNIEDVLPSITVPVLVVQGDDDEYGTLEQLDRIENGVSGPVERLVVRDGGHAPHLLHPEVVASAIVDFLDRWQ